MDKVNFGVITHAGEVGFVLNESNGQLKTAWFAPGVAEEFAKKMLMAVEDARQQLHQMKRSTTN